MKAVLDTNVFISGIFWEGNFCSQIIAKWKRKELGLISSPKIIEEFIKTLREFKILMPEEDIHKWKNMIIENSIIVNPIISINVIKEDPEDNKFIEAAVYGEADLIISQDKHLLKLKEYQNIKIIKPEEALTLI